MFTATFTAPFIREDSSYLQSQYSVQEIISSGSATFITFLKQLSTADVTFSWFASVYSSLLVLFAKIFNARSIIVLGGVDVANIPELNYGIWNSWWRAMIVRYGIKHADVVLAVDDSLKRDAMDLARYDGRNIHIVPTGYDSERWKPGKKKEKIVLTVAQCDTLTRVKIKGIDFLFKVAKEMPDQPFVLVGLKEEIARQFKIPRNVTWYESVQQDDLLKFYQKAAVYFQPSFREGLPNTLCEAMLCGCFPIGTLAGGIPTAIGNTGIIISYGNISEAIVAIMNGLDKVKKSSPRERISTMFAKNKREQQLSYYIETLINAK